MCSVACACPLRSKRFGMSIDLAIGDMPVRQPVEVRGRLRGEPELEEGVQRERGVAQPGEPVVPVALSADILREARCGRRDDRSGGRVGHELQRERRSPDVHLVGAVVVHLADPAPPVALALRGATHAPARRSTAWHRNDRAAPVWSANADRLGGPEHECVVWARRARPSSSDRDGASPYRRGCCPSSTVRVTGARANPGAGSKT